MPRNRSREEWKTYKNVFDKFTEEVIVKMQGQGHFDQLDSPVALGKEANIFTARKGDEVVIVKIYRTMNCNFNKMHEYLAHDDRYLDIKNNKRQIIFAWVQREAANLFLAREHINVPSPYTFAYNVIVMDMIQVDGKPAPMLKDKPPKDPQAFYDDCVKQLAKLRKAGLVHGDISAFNILNKEDVPVFIDFSQATTATSHGADELYKRDLENLKLHFAKLGVKNL